MIRLARSVFPLFLFLTLLLFAADASAIDAAKVVGPETCGNCHRQEYEKWKSTRHYQLLDTLYKSPAAQRIAQAMGERLIKVQSLCLTCHFTPKEMSGKLTATAGVSCESCHGPARDWLNIHNDFGKQFNHDTEPPEHKKQRLAQAAAAGMYPPEQIYLLASNCFGCHTVQNEKLVNTGGHPAGSDFDLPARVDVIRHNFVRAGRNVNAPITPERKRVMYVVGYSLALEYGLRGAALATEDGTFIKNKASLVRSALGELRSIKSAVNLPEINTIVDAAQGLQIKPQNTAELTHAADKIRDAGKVFVEKYDGSKLAALDSLMSGSGEEESASGEAAGTGDNGAGGQQGGKSPAGGGTKTAGGTGAAGDLKRHIRPAPQHKTIGPNCGCHGDQNKWWSGDKHNSSAQPFWDENPKNVKIARLYGISPTDMKNGQNICMDCHGTVVSGKESKEVADGVSCENCHGSAADYVKIHNDGKSFKPDVAFANGMNNLFDVNVRAEKCTGCHYVTEPRLISAGHPSNANFDYASAIVKIKHWKKADDTAQFKAAVDAAIAKRGAVPKVQMASLPAATPETETPAGGPASKPASGGATGGAVTPGEVKRHIRPASTHKTIGPNQCTGCHKEASAWWGNDKHNTSAQPFWDDNPKNVQIAQRYGISSSEMKNGNNLCMDCHGTVVSGKESREVADGVSCENCHGAGADYIKAHNDGKNFKPNEAYASGMNKLQDYSVRAEKCTGCHYITEAKLIAAGHPTNANFDYATAIGKIKHWKQADDLNQFKSAVSAAIAKRGPIPKVQVIGGPITASAPAAGSAPTGKSTTGSRPNPLAPRPAGPNAPRPADAKPIDLPPFPEIKDSATLDQVLSILQKRLELLHAKTGAAHD